MKYKRFRFIFLAAFTIVSVFLFAGRKEAEAQIIDPHPACPASNPACWPTRRVNQHSCTDCSREYYCQGDTSKTCPSGKDSECVDAYGSYGPCILLCDSYTYSDICELWVADVACNNINESSCSWVGDVLDCIVDEIGQTCTETRTEQELGCCGPGEGGVTPPPPPPPPPPLGCSVSAPYNPVESNLTSSSVSLSWLEGSGGTAANLIRIGTDQTAVESGCPSGTGPGTGCVVRQTLGRGVESFSTGDILSSNTTYYWRVAEYDSNTGDRIDFGNVCNSDFSETFTTLACTYPSDLSESSITQDSAVLNWTPGSGGSTQYLRVSTSLDEVNNGCPSGFAGCSVIRNNIASGVGSFDIAAQDRGDGSGPAVLDPNTTYYWRVVEYVDSDNWCDSADSFVTQDIPACTAPANNPAASLCKDQTSYDATWNWGETAGANEYQLVVSTGSGANFFANVVYDSGWQSSALFSCGGGTCSFEMIKFISGVRYYSRVRSRGLSCTASNWSNETSVYEDCVVACPAPSMSPVISSCDTTDSTIDVTWTFQDLSASGVVSYRLQVDQTPADWAGLARNLVLTPGVNLTCGGGVCSYETTDLPAGSWSARVRAESDNGISCTADPLVWSATETITDECRTQVVGQVFSDPGGNALLVGGMCELIGAPGVRPGTGSSVVVDPGAYTDANIDLSGSFAAPETPPNIAPGTYTASLNPTGDWVCTCPSNCTYTVDVPQPDTVADPDSPDQPLEYYVSELRDPWFQTIGGDVHSTGSITSFIPGSDSCVAPACTPEFSLPGTDEVGVVSLSPGGTSDYGSGTVSGQSWEAESGYSGPIYLYDFWRRESDPPNPLTDCSGLNNSPGAGVHQINCTTDLTLSGNWSGISQSITVFVNAPGRTLTLDPANGISITDPGLFTLITNAARVQVADRATNIQGIYLVDGEFRSCATDGCGYDPATGNSYQLNVLGSVIAWNGVDLQRDLYIENRNTPAEVFTYEPDFIPRLPDFILRAIYTWEEVAP